MLLFYTDPEAFVTGAFVKIGFFCSYSELLGIVSRKDVKTPVKKLVKTLVKTPEAILMLLRKNPKLTLAEAAESLDKATSAVERASCKAERAGQVTLSRT